MRLVRMPCISPLVSTANNSAAKAHAATYIASGRTYFTLAGVPVRTG